MLATIIIRTKDEADRLRLTLASLSRQSAECEIVVVNDGSSDHTQAVLAAAKRQMPLSVVTNAVSAGRSAAANAGAKVAAGDLLIFLDGDTLAGRDFVACHLAAHAGNSGLLARGETLHVRGTRFLADPDRGTPRPGEEARIARATPSELGRMRVTMDEVLSDFTEIEKKSKPGIYPGAGPALLYELEMDALITRPEIGVLWAAASGCNQSVTRMAFLEARGFCDEISINEHRELALRLCQAGLRMAPAPGARTHHLTHRTGWRDPAVETAWESAFFARHPRPEVALLRILWASLAQPLPFPAIVAIRSLPELEEAARACDGKGLRPEEIRSAHVTNRTRKALWA